MIIIVSSAKSGLIRQGIENQVDYPPEVANDQRKISELASWLQAPPTSRGGNKIVFHQPDAINNAHQHQHHHQQHFTTQATAGTGPLLRNTWPKSAPTSPLSPGSPTDNRIIRSASSR